MPNNFWEKIVWTVSERKTRYERCFSGWSSWWPFMTRRSHGDDGCPWQQRRSSGCVAPRHHRRPSCQYGCTARCRRLKTFCIYWVTVRNTCAFQAVGTTEGWLVSLVLGDFHFLDDFTEGSTVTGSVFTDNTDLLGSLGHISSRFFVWKANSH